MRVQDAPPETPQVPRTLACRCNEVPQAIIDLIEKEDKKEQAVIELRGKIIDQWDSVEQCTICFMHKKMLVGTAGFQVKRLTFERMSNRRLQQYWEECHNLQRFKTSAETWSWFRAADTPWRLADNSGHFKYEHRELALPTIRVQSAVLVKVHSFVDNSEENRCINLKQRIDWHRSPPNGRS